MTIEVDIKEKTKLEIAEVYRIPQSTLSMYIQNRMKLRNKLQKVQKYLGCESDEPTIQI
jgi:hypothetical protein